MQAMARPAYSALCSHARDGRPALVFVPTRKHARATALDLLTFAAADGEPTKFLQLQDDLTPYLGASSGLAGKSTQGKATLHCPGFVV